MNLKLIFCILILVPLSFVKAANLVTEQTFEFNIPPSKASQALEIIAKLTGADLLYPAEKLSKLQTNTIHGSYTLTEALEIILYGTSVEASVTKKGVIIIHDRRKKKPETKSSKGFWATLFSDDDKSEDTTVELAAEQKRKLALQAKDEMERIVVTGHRESLSKALSHKRNADYQLDVISAEDIGKLPDVEIGDVLERIAGVQVSRGDDGVVNGTSIRGLPGYFNRTLYNGRVISTSLSTERFFDSQIMPAAFVSRVEVHKTAVADVVEGGLAGVVNLKSIRAFDIGERAVRLKVSGNTTSNDNNTNSDIIAIFSDVYLDDTLGFATGINLLDADTESQKGLIFNPVIKLTEGVGKDYNGDGSVSNKDNFYVPRSIDYTLNQNSRQRRAVFANLEWRPTNTFRVFAEVFYSNYQTLNIRNNLSFKPKPANTSEGSDAQTESYQGPLYPAGARDYLTVYHPNNIFAEVANQHNERDSDTGVAFVDIEWFADRWTFNLGANISKSKTEQFTVEAKSLTAKNYFDAIFDGTDLDNAWTVYLHDPIDDHGYSQRGLLNDPQAPFRSLTVNGQQLGAEYESNSWGADFQAQYEFMPTNNLININSLQLGLHYSEDESLANKPFANFLGNTDELFNGAEMTYRKVEPASGDWFDGNDSQSGTPPVWVVPDIEKMINSYHWSAESMRAAAIAIDSYNPGIRDDLKEDIVASFVRINFASETEQLTGNFGLRYVKTKQFSSGQGSNIEQGLIDLGSGEPLDPDYVAELMLPVEGDITKQRDYDNLLPSLNLRYLATEELVLRLGWSKTMTRPLRQDLKVLDRYIPNSNTIISPDPELEPFESENFDVSFEWYFAEQSAFSLALFYKDIDSLVFARKYDRVVPVIHAETGIELDGIVVQMDEKTNGKGAIIKGSTIVFQQPFSYLPWFLAHTGIKVNYTYIKNSQPDQLINISKDNASVLLYYDYHNFDAQINYTYRSEGVSQLSTATVPLQYFNSSNTVNVSASYSPTPYLNVNFGIHNLTEQANSEYYANGMSNTFSDYGRIYSLTITGKL